MRKIRLAAAGAVFVVSMLMFVSLMSMLTTTASAYEPPVGIVGYVKNKYANFPIADALVSAGGVSDWTDDNGFYFLNLPRQGSFVVTVNCTPGYFAQSKSVSITSSNPEPQLDFDLVPLRYDSVKFVNGPYSITSNGEITIRCWHWGTSYLRLWVRCPDGTIGRDSSGAVNARQISSKTDSYTDIKLTLTNQQTYERVGMWHFHATSSDFGAIEDRTYVKQNAADPIPTDIFWLDVQSTNSFDPNHSGSRIYGYNVNYIHTSAATVKVNFVTALLSSSGLLKGPEPALGPASSFTCQVKTIQSPGSIIYSYSTYDCVVYWNARGDSAVPNLYRGVQLVSNGIMIQEMWDTLNPYGR